MTSSNAKALLTQEFCPELYWLHQFLQVFNGKRHFFEKLPVIDVQTDACVAAVRAFFQEDWVYLLLAADFPQYLDLHINYKEAFAIFLAAKRWGCQWENCHAIIHSDNQATVAMINKGTTSNPLVMSFLRELFWMSATLNFRITARYVPSIDNHISDAISRLHESDKLLFFFMSCYCYVKTVMLLFIVITKPQLL